MEYHSMRCAMKILVNRKIKKLFCSVLLNMVLFTIISIVFIILEFEYMALSILFCTYEYSCIDNGLQLLQRAK